jgi:undecaprenyl-diphosphatase
MRPSRAFALGLLHGPAELLPVSSSAHAGLALRDLPPERRKELEVALHAGTLVALGPPRPAAWLVVSTLPPALAGALLERPIERRLGGPRATAIGLLLGGAALALADLKGSDPSLRAHMKVTDTCVAHALVLGLAQAVALVPGVSRHGAALTALRALGYPREEAHALSVEASKPVLLGATVLKALRMRREDAPVLAAAAAGSALSTLAARRALAGRGVRGPLWPFALYRAALAASLWRHGRS